MYYNILRCALGACDKATCLWHSPTSKYRCTAQSRKCLENLPIFLEMVYTVNKDF